MGFLASVFAMMLGWLPEGTPFNFGHASLLCACAVVTASVASSVLGTFIIYLKE